MTDCALCFSNGWDHEAIREECRRSIFLASVRLCGWERMADSLLHEAVCMWLQKKLESRVKEVWIFLPRDFLKTTILSALLVWWWINNPELRVMLAHASSEQSSKLVPVVQNIIIGDAMQHFFPEIVPSTGHVRWNKKELEVKREGNYAQASLEAHGVGSSLEGGHFDKHLFDDIVDRKAAKSAIEMDDVRSFYSHSVSLFDSPETEQSVGSATMWEGGFYDDIVAGRSGDPDAAILVLGAECDERFIAWADSMGLPKLYEGMKVGEVGKPMTGDSIWPQWFPNKRLRQRFSRLGIVNYCRQMLNVEAIDEEAMFHKNMIEHYYIGANQTLVISNQRQVALSECDIFATVDPGGGESARSDETAINVCAYYRPKGWAFVLEERAGKWLPLIIIEQIIEMVQTWQPFGLKKVGIEEVALQSYLKHFLRQEMGRRHINFIVEPLKVKSRGMAFHSKATRILKRLQPFVANGQVFFLKHQQKLIREMLGLRVIEGKIVGRSPNRLDALAWQTHFWGNVNAGDEDGDDEKEAIPFVNKVKAPYGLRLN